MRYKNDKINPSHVSRIDMTFEIDGSSIPCLGAGKPCFDLELNPSLSGGIKFVEFKSYLPTTDITQLNQLKSYFGNISDISELAFVFNQGKTSLSEAKAILGKAIKNNKPGIFDSMNDNLKTSLGLDDLFDLTNDLIDNEILEKIVKAF